MTLLPLTLLSLTLASAPPGDAKPQPPGETWRFVLPAPGDPFEHPPFRALVLSREKPEDVSEKVAYRGNSRRYGQLRFGSPGSIRVTVVLDEVGPGDVDLFVDANRDRKIDDRDRVAGTKGSSGREQIWRLPLDVAMVEGEVTKTTRRALIFRLGATGRTLGYAAAGYLEGTVTMEGQPRTVRRMDGDGNGLMTDAQDRLWIDLNRDGRWDAASEQFLYATILNLEGVRYVLRSDPLGDTAGARTAGRHGDRPARTQEGQGHRPARDPGRPRRLGLWPLRQRARDRSGRRVPAEHGHGGIRRSPGRAELVVHLLRQRRQG